MYLAYLDFQAIRSATQSTRHHISSIHGPDCTGIHFRFQRGAAIAGSIITCALAFAAWAPAARADGDPASDVLSVQEAFVPADAGALFRQQLQLNALLHQTARRGYPLRVAIVASPADLGSVSALWHHPQAYARFLGSELALVFHGTVLVVMPNGYGTDVTAAGTRRASGEAELPLPGRRLASAAIVAVKRLASSAGTPVSAQAVPGVTAARPDSTLPWIAFSLGLLVAATAWALSFRRRPLRLHPGGR